MDVQLCASGVRPYAFFPRKGGGRKTRPRCPKCPSRPQVWRCDAEYLILGADRQEGNGVPRVPDVPHLEPSDVLRVMFVAKRTWRDAQGNLFPRLSLHSVFPTFTSILCAAIFRAFHFFTAILTFREARRALQSLINAGFAGFSMAIISPAVGCKVGPPLYTCFTPPTGARVMADSRSRTPEK